jgi:hypothetical protein
MCEPVLDGNALIREWRMVRNIICDYKNFRFIEAWYRIFNNIIVILVFVISFLV